MPPVGQELASAQPLNTVYRLADAAQRDPNVNRILAGPGDHLDELSAQAPEFHAAVLAELKLIGHRGPAEVEMRSASYADDPEMLIRMVAKSLNIPTRPETRRPAIPLQARPVARLAAHQLRDREIRRDRMVRAIWLLRNLLRELGRRLANSGVLDAADDVFYLLVDELDALPTDASTVGRAQAHRTTHTGRRRAAPSFQRQLARRYLADDRPGPWEDPAAASASAADGCAAVCGSSGQRPSTTYNPGRSWSPRSPMSATPPHSPTRPRW